MDWSLRTKLLVGFGTVALVGAVLTVPTGGLLLRKSVLGEAERRVVLGLRTADAMLQWRLNEARQAARSMADVAALRLESGQGVTSRDLEAWRAAQGFDFVQLADARALPVAGSRARPTRAPVFSISVAYSSRQPISGLALVPLAELERESPALAQQARVEVIPTPRAKPGGPDRLDDALVLEAAAPILDSAGKFRGAIRAGTVVNGNFEFVDFVRRNVFATATYRGKNAGTVTIFQGDVRVATNVQGPDGKRAVGTRVSAEVHDRVLVAGGLWEGPAFVVGNWYMSAYEPLRDLRGRIVGMLYVGVLKERYDDMGAQAMRSFIGLAALALLGAVVLSAVFARRFARPLARLTQGATEIARGNLDYDLPPPARAQHDEIRRLSAAFHQMLAALRGRDEQLRSSNAELQQWVQNYLDILEFITHELKNQIAAMTINVLAVRDGYVGEITDEQRAALDDVAKTIERSEEMILNYLNLSRIEKGELQVRAQALNLASDVIRPVLKDLRGRLEARRMRVEVEMDDDLAAWGDASLLKIVYSNLINNAAKYGRDDGVVRLRGEKAGGLVTLHVWNDGPGVPEGQTGELFRKFSRIHAPMDEQPGTGLGLFITREITRRHGGDIRVENSPGEWIDFVFTLPTPDAV
ncbi:MAG: HAMP domain-containing protein [Armatimonadetes bacterium]|nr:HAMP domain-containing protein [Armatimonadota bacterium]